MSLPAQNPTRVRYGVLGFACALSMITYLDRVCVGTVMGDMQREFEFSDTQRGFIFGAFTLAYAIFEVPTGWLGDKFGPKKTLIRIVLWWSVFTALTGLIYPTAFWPPLAFGLMLVVRFLFGMGEAGAYPNIARAFHNWFPLQERGTAKGTVWMAGRFAGGVTPMIVLALIYEHQADGQTTVSWRHTFWIFGGLGVAWSLCFWWWFRDRPEQKAGVNAAEIALIHHGASAHHEGEFQVPWRRLLKSGNLWLLCGMYWCGAYGWYFNITYLPDYLHEQFGVPKGTKWTEEWWTFSLMAGLPLLFGSTACLFGGLLTDWFIKRTGNRKWGRRLFGMLGHGMCALCYFSAIAMKSPWLFVLGIALAAFWNDITMGASWASCLDIGGRYSGIVSGCMNTIGNLGGFMANIITGWVLGLFTHGIDKKTHLQDYVAASQPGWTLNFLLFGSVYVVAVVLWAFFDASKPVVPEAVNSQEPLP
jgi:ACS family glucarate transporter-like MFS transporter